MKKLSTATILAIVMTLLLVTGALASFTNGNFETGDFTGWTKDTANQNGGILVGPPPSYVPHPVGSVDDMFIVNTAWMNANFGAGITCDPYSNGLICLPYAGANSAVVNYLGNNGNLNKLTQAGLVASGDLGPDGNYHIFFAYAPVLDKGSHTPADQPFMYVKLVRVRSGSPDVILFDKFSYPDDGNPNWQISPIRSSVKFMPWQVYDLTYAPGDLTPGDTLTLEVVAAGCVYFQGAHWGYVYVDEFGPTAPAGNTAPSISSVSPASGPDTGGTSVTITGVNFTGATAVKIGTTTLLAGSFTIVNDTTITFTTPANAAGLVDVSVTNPNGSAVYPYSYTFLGSPTITSIIPNSGSVSGGTSVVITGTYLTDGTVTFDGLPATCTVDLATQITCASPAHAAGPVDVVVTTPVNTATSTGGFTYIAPPTITGIVPNSGPAAGGTSVVITGTNLTTAYHFEFGATPATCIVNSDTQVTCTSPAHAAGPVDVDISTIGGIASSVGGFTYVLAPTITSIVPNSGSTAGGTSVVITGTALTGGTVTFDGLPATCTVDSPTQMTCTSPAHAAGAVDVVVTTPGGQATSAGGFTYIAQSITSITPNSGPTGGGTSVVISGTGFTGSTGFTFGGTAATCTVDSDVQITCTTPAHAAGAVDVVVTTPTGAITLTGGFTYIPSTLTLTASGPTTIKPGAQYVYTFNYTRNVKPFNARVVFSLPGHTTFVSNTGGYTCTPAAGVVTCNLGGITANGSFTATVQVDKLKKVNTPLTLATTAYSISDNGAAVVNGAATVTANTLAPFDDVPAGYWASDHVQAIWAAGITSGCSTSPALYCPTTLLSRAQMAVFIERGVHGSSFVPPVVPITFNDTATHSARYWIEALKADGITTGCGTGAGFCPDASITRAEMSIFLLRGKYGRAHVPPAATGTVWNDVLKTTWAAAWMEQLGRERISTGCGSGNYCPGATISRGEMAVLFQRTFNLPMPTP